MGSELKGLSGTTCEDCGVELFLDVYYSAAGYYLGYWCFCSGPYSRETEYFDTAQKAYRALRAWLTDGVVPANVRE